MLRVIDIYATFQHDLTTENILKLLDILSEKGLLNAPELNDDDFRYYFTLSDDQLYHIFDFKGEYTRLFVIYYILRNDEYMKGYFSSLSPASLMELAGTIKGDEVKDLINDELYKRNLPSETFKKLVKKSVPSDDQGKVTTNYIVKLINENKKDEAIDFIKNADYLIIRPLLIAFVDKNSDELYLAFLDHLKKVNHLDDSRAFEKMLRYISSVKGVTNEILDMIFRHTPKGLKINHIGTYIIEKVLDIYRTSPRIASLIVQYIPDVLNRLESKHVKIIEEIINEQV